MINNNENIIENKASEIEGKIVIKNNIKYSKQFR